MSHYRYHLVIILSVALLLVACGPSAEQIASMTAAAATSTPVPTNTPAPTATPNPDLNITVTGVDDQPVEGASVTLSGYGLGTDGNTFQTDASGKVSAPGLTEAQGTVSARAPGYKPSEQTPEVKPGSNDVAVALERDPAGLLPSEACSPGEKLLYMDDFQDGDAQGWNEISFQTMGWTFGPDADAPDNTIVMAQRSGEGGVNSMLQGDYKFENAVWRLRYRIAGQGTVSLNWLQSNNFDLNGQHIDDSRYQIVFDTAGGRSEVRRLQQPVLNITAARGKSITPDVWHLIEIGTFEGATEVWLDGASWAQYKDPKPVPPGTIGLEIFPDQSEETVISFDNIAVCELSAAFAPMPTPTTNP